MGTYQRTVLSVLSAFSLFIAKVCLKSEVGDEKGAQVEDSKVDQPQQMHQLIPDQWERSVIELIFKVHGHEIFVSWFFSLIILLLLWSFLRGLCHLEFFKSFAEIF